MWVGGVGRPGLARAPNKPPPPPLLSNSLVRGLSTTTGGLPGSPERVTAADAPALTPGNARGLCRHVPAFLIVAHGPLP